MNLDPHIQNYQKNSGQSTRDSNGRSDIFH